MKRLTLILGVFLLSTIFLTCTSRVTPVEKPVLPEAAIATQATSKELWQAEWERTMAEARKEGKVVIYLEANSSGARDPMIKAMKQNFGLDAEILALISAELNAKLLTERKAGLFYHDIVITGGGSLTNTLVPAGVFGPMEPNLILPEVKEAKNWREGVIPWFDKDKLTLNTGRLVLAGAFINTNLVKKDEMKSYQDLLNPKWKGKIVIQDPTIPGPGVRTFQIIAELMGKDFLRQLASQEPLLNRDSRLLTEWISTGKQAIGIGINPYSTDEVRKIGAPVDYVEFKEGAGLASPAASVGIMDKPAHPNASRVFINWFLSREGQNLFSLYIATISRRIDASTDHLSPVFVPKPGVRYLEDTPETYLAWVEMNKLGREIFGN